MTEVRDSSAEDFLDVITTVSLQLAGADDTTLDAAIDAVLGAIGRHEGAHRAYVTLYGADGSFSNSHEWVADGVRSHRADVVDWNLSSFPYSAGLAAQGKVWHCPDVDALPPEACNERASFAAYGVVSVLEVPMRNGAQIIGVVGFNHVGQRSAWDAITIDRVRRMGEAIGLSLVRRNANRAVRAARDEAERASRAKDAFLSRVSHELRTPLHAILGFAELLDTPGRTELERQAVQQIVGGGRHLLGLVEEMLAVAVRSSAAQPPIE